jgi:septal ring factor EnvC (AmiA/AmiB activator)
MKWPKCGLACAGVSLLLLAPKTQAQRKNDPLNQLEINQLRDSAQEPDTRLRLYVKFARDRLATLEQSRSDPKVSDKAQQTHDHLQAFVDVYDELNDNIDTFAGQRQDIRGVLKVISAADTEFQAKLHALKDASANKDELKQYEFVLTDALDDLDNSAKDHVQLLADQEDAAKHKKLLKPIPASRANLPPQ